MCSEAYNYAREHAGPAARNALQYAQGVVAAVAQSCQRKRRRGDQLLRGPLGEDETLRTFSGLMYKDMDMRGNNSILPEFHHGHWLVTQEEFQGQMLTMARTHEEYPFVPRGDLGKLIEAYNKHLCLGNPAPYSEKAEQLARCKELFDLSAAVQVTEQMPPDDSAESMRLWELRVEGLQVKRQKIAKVVNTLQMAVEMLSEVDSRYRKLPSVVTWFSRANAIGNPVSSDAAAMECDLDLDDLIADVVKAEDAEIAQVVPKVVDDLIAQVVENTLKPADDDAEMQPIPDAGGDAMECQPPASERRTSVFAP